MNTQQSWITKYWQYIVMVILLALIIWFGKDKLAPGIARNPSTLPIGLTGCGNDGCDIPGGGHASFQGLPGEVLAYFLPKGDETILRTQPKDGFQCLGPIFGNLAFYNSKTKALVTQFDVPVTFQYTPTADEIAAINKCQESTKTEFIPVYLYLPIADKSVNIWKPFQLYEVNSDTKAFTIVFKFWGDPQFGGGTR